MHDLQDFFSFEFGLVGIMVIWIVEFPMEGYKIRYILAKEIVERRHGEPILNSYFCQKWAFWAARPVMKKIAGCEF